MKTLLVLAEHPGLVEAIRSGLDARQFRVLHRTEVEAAEPLLTHGLVDVCILDADLTGVQAIWTLDKLVRRTNKCPVLVYTEEKDPAWEEQAYARGVAQVLAKPVRPQLLLTALDRLRGQNSITSPSASAPSLEAPTTTNTEMMERFGSTSQTLALLQNFSSILSHSLDAEAMLKQVLLFLRETLSVNRAAIFLRQPFTAMSSSEPGEGRRLRSVCAIGLSSGILDHLELSFEAGIGGQVYRLGRILRRNNREARADSTVQKEFDLLGTQVAVPILDRESVVGLAVFDDRITGEPLVNSELELVFHLLEQVGLAVRNIWLHDQLAQNHETMTRVLRELSSACIVVGSNLKILHANKSARRFFSATGRATGDLDFADLPQLLGTKVYQVLRTGTAITPFKYEPEGQVGSVFNITVVPFQRKDTALPVSALLMAEDLTQSEQLRRLEVEAANLRLIKTMAERLAHEIGNAVMPLSTHQQLFNKKQEDPEFRSSLGSALLESTQRISRLGQQMLYLAQDPVAGSEPIPISQLIKDAFREAQKNHPQQSVFLQHEIGDQSLKLSGDRAGLKHALAEVMLNALQANPPSPKIKVSTRSEKDTEGNQWVRIEVQDAGTGFSPEAARKVTEPFFTTRNVGLGLGLTVTRRIIESHHGRLDISDEPLNQSGLVTISLPLSGE
jgi:signal transduction histidine kinase/DNA-binding NarL/FixJ family response regulator